MIFDFIVSLGMMGLVLLTQKWAVGADPSDKVNQLRHSDSDSSVELLTWGRDTIIHRGRKDIYLSHYPPQNSVVVLIVNDVPWTKGDLRNLSGEFTVHAPQRHGIMAVVQVLYLRSGGNDHCIDYIQFYDPITALGSPKTCGKLSKENKAFSPPDVVGARVFNSPSGMMQVAYRSAKGDPTFPIDKNYDLSFHMVEVVFTAYKECNFVTNHDSHSRCGDACIASTVFCDERINCGSPDEFAVDEENCPGQNDSDGHIFSQHVGSFLVSIYLGAGIFFTILAAVTCYHQHKAYQRIKSIPHK
ncbi:uncharacterized protein LOC110852360 [Folsomia candida]|uniref:uncharacterized protein LOC110852360 n=1 Tax=Folsomia candida TaxID=158441 RepID=UPI0016051D1A|nr:uncharacterized protein LOC110852360 [Folsomia candida]